jgi:hypothetical protein
LWEQGHPAEFHEHIHSRQGCCWSTCRNLKHSQIPRSQEVNCPELDQEEQRKFLILKKKKKKERKEKEKESQILSPPCNPQG